MEFLHRVNKHLKRMEMQKKGIGPNEVQLFELHQQMKDVELAHLKIATEQLLEIAQKRPESTRKIFEQLAEYMKNVYDTRRKGT